VSTEICSLAAALAARPAGFTYTVEAIDRVFRCRAFPPGCTAWSADAAGAVEAMNRMLMAWEGAKIAP